MEEDNAKTPVDDGKQVGTQTNQDLRRFPVMLIASCTAITETDSRGSLNNPSVLHK